MTQRAVKLVKHALAATTLVSGKEDLDRGSKINRLRKQVIILTIPRIVVCRGR